MNALAEANPKPQLVAITRHPPGENPALVYVASLTTSSGRRAMSQALEKISEIISQGRATASTLDWAALRFQHTQAIRTALVEAGYKPATINKELSALRGTLKAAWQMGQMDAESYRRAASVANVKGSTLPAGRDLSEGEIRALMACCSEDDRPAGFRDAALLAVLCLGLRRAEAVNLDLEDYDSEAGSLKVRGKGRKERLVYACEGAGEALADWLKVRPDQPGPLLLPIRKGGTVLAGRLSTQAVYEILRSRGSKAGVKPFSPHDLRRTFVGALLDAGADVSVVSRLAGHASVTTTARYDRRGEKAKRKAASLLHVPYRRRL